MKLAILLAIAMTGCAGMPVQFAKPPVPIHNAPRPIGPRIGGRHP